MDKRITLNEAREFHGHLGPYLVLGVLAGECALERLGCKKYFDLEVKVYGATQKPKSCLIDGLQLSTGATYGKGNIKKKEAKNIRIDIKNLKSRNKISLDLKDKIIKELEGLKDHNDSELMAKKIYKQNPKNIFKLLTNTNALSNVISSL